MNETQTGLTPYRLSQALTLAPSSLASDVYPTLSSSGTLNLSLFDLGEHRIACPRCKKNASDKTLGVTVRSMGDAVAHCFRCGLTESLRGRKNTHYQPIIKPTRPQEERYTSLSAWGRTLWAQCTPLSGVALDYLTARKCLIPPRDGDLRWHSSLRHPSGYVGAALVGLVTHAETGEMLSLHRTWITSSGKAQVSPNRMLAGGHPTKYGVIRLFPDEYVTTGLGVAEGIETALSLAHEMQPVWAAISAGNMGCLPVLKGIEYLTVGVDSDSAGRKATDELSRRWYSAGIRVRHVVVPYGDLNDHLEASHG